MVSRLFARRKKATTIVSKQTLEQAVQEARGAVERLMESAPKDSRIDQLQNAISFLESIINKSSVEMQQEGAATLDDYLDDAVMPEMAQKIKQDVDMIANTKNATPQQTQEAPIATATIASGSDNWVNDREEDGKPKTPELAEVPRMAAAVAPAPAPAPPVKKPNADITQLSSDTLAKMQKALAGSEDLMNDKAAQAFIAAIAEELMNRPVEVEAPEAPAPAAGAAPLPVAAAFGGLSLVAADNDGGDKFAVTSPDVSVDQKVRKALEHAAVSIHHPACKCKGAYSANPEKYCTCHVYKAQDALHSLGKKASGQGGSWFVNDGDTGSVTESGGRTPEIAEAHSEVDDNTGISRPATVAPIKLAAEMTTSKAVKMVERLADQLKALYLEAKPVTTVLDSRPVREAVESVYRAYDMLGEAAKVLNKLNMQEEQEAAALEVKDKNKKKSSVLFGLTLAANDEEDDPEEICPECGYTWGRCRCEYCPDCHLPVWACECIDELVPKSK